MQDHLQTKEKIIYFLKTRGPSLPVHIAKEINQSILFTSAFLSELLSEKRIKTSFMRIGSSPIYLLPGQEIQIEKYLDNIKGKEKEALLLLKEKKFLEDETQHPAIRVALRTIKDFAIPFEKNNKQIWRYFRISESEFEDKEKEKSSQFSEDNKSTNEQTPQRSADNVFSGGSERLRGSGKSSEAMARAKSGVGFRVTVGKKQQGSASESNKAEEKEISSEKSLDIFDKPKEEKQKEKKKIKKKTTKKKSSSKTNEKFFNKVKEFLKEKQIEIKEIESIGKKELVFLVNKNNEELLLFAHDKKQIKEEDLLNANKKAIEKNKKYIILSFGDPLKRVTNLIDAIQNLSEIEKIE